MSYSNSKYHASCFCDAVAFELTGQPELMAYCHCNSCRHWSAGPVSNFTLWQPDSLTVIKGEQHIKSFDKNSVMKKGEVLSERTWCDRCGGHLFTKHPSMGLIDVPAAVIAAFKFTPAFHVHYQEAVLPVLDGLPKFQDLPEPAGGSGILIEE